MRGIVAHPNRTPIRIRISSVHVGDGAEAPVGVEGLVPKVGTDKSLG
jgi:hypothetical protein